MICVSIGALSTSKLKSKNSRSSKSAKSRLIVLILPSKWSAFSMYKSIEKYGLLHTWSSKSFIWPFSNWCVGDMVKVSSETCSSELVYTAGIPSFINKSGILAPLLRNSTLIPKCLGVIRTLR